MVWEMSFEEFKDGRHGGHPGYRNRTILEILNLYVAPIFDFSKALGELKIHFLHLYQRLMVETYDV